MKVRIKFTKQGPVKFIGHLDMMRYFQKAMRRASVDMKYSEGFSPHQIMSFASPLSLGLTSNGEYFDIEVHGTLNCLDIAEKLNQVMVDGIQIVSCRPLAENSKNAMSLVAAADYTLSFREKFEPKEWRRFSENLKSFCDQEQIVVVKKTKKGERELDIKPLIHSLKVEKPFIHMRLSSGSDNNLKPDFVMESYYRWMGEELPPFALLIQRDEVYGNVGTESLPKFVPLEEIGVI